MALQAGGSLDVCGDRGTTKRPTGRAFLQLFLCRILPRTPQYIVSWEMLEVSGDVWGQAGMNTGQASVRAWSCRRCNIYSLIFSFLAEKLKLIVPALAGV